jgi:hypothetical protein
VGAWSVTTAPPRVELAVSMCSISSASVSSGAGPKNSAPQEQVRTNSLPL